MTLADIVDTDLDGFFENGCPKDITVKKLLPHENCGQYYECFHGALISRICPNGLYFNSDLERCDRLSRCPKKFNIQPDKTSDDQLDNNNPNDAALICSSPDSNDILIAHENCNEFYMCAHGRPVLLKCARDLLFNTVTEKCDWPQNVDCGERLGGVSESYSSSKENYNPSQAASLCSSTQSNSLLIAHEYCDKFYKCWEGIPIPVKCPNKLLYDPIKEHCDRPVNVQCEGRIISEDESSNKNVDDMENNKYIKDNEISVEDDHKTPAALCVAGDDVVAHEFCNHFYKCSGYVPIAFKCPEILLFNANTKLCDWPKNADCGDRIDFDVTDFETERKIDNPKKICSAENSDGVLIAHENCNKYYKCRDGYPVLLKCSGMLLYNPKTEKCDWSVHFNCDGRTIPENERWKEILRESDDNENNNNTTDNRTPGSGLVLMDDQAENGNVQNFKNDSESDSGYEENYGYLREAAKNCAAANSDGLLFPHENCHQYYKCFQGEAEAQFCQLNLFYNPKKEYCDWLHNANCSNRVVPANDSKEEKYRRDADGICMGLTDGTILPHENCSQFYKCVNNQKYSMQCLPGLYYDTKLKVCDWPRNVDCGDRLTEAQLRHN